MKFTYTHRGLLDRRSADIVTDLAFGDEVRISRDPHTPDNAHTELHGLMGVFSHYTPKGYAIIMLNQKHPWADTNNCVSVHPESLIWLRHRGEMFDAYSDVK